MYIDEKYLMDKRRVLAWWGPLLSLGMLFLALNACVYEAVVPASATAISVADPTNAALVSPTAVATRIPTVATTATATLQPSVEPESSYTLSPGWQWFEEDPPYLIAHPHSWKKTVGAQRDWHMFSSPETLAQVRVNVYPLPTAFEAETWLEWLRQNPDRWALSQPPETIVENAIFGGQQALFLYQPLRLPWPTRVRPFLGKISPLVRK